MVQLQTSKPKAIIFDMSGTVAKTAFIDRVLIPYFVNYVAGYVTEKWQDHQLVKDIKRLRTQSKKDAARASSEVDSTPTEEGGASPPTTAPTIAESTAPDEEQQQSVVNYINWAMNTKLDNTRAFQLFRFHMWFDGYSRGNLETPVYSDVAIQIKKWAIEDDIKLYVYSNGWSEATRLFMSKTNHGDLSVVINDFFDTSIGSLTSTESYQKILEKIGFQPEDVLFLTKNGPEARAAASTGINAVLVLTHRKDIERLDEQDRGFPRIRSFMELEFL